MGNVNAITTEPPWDFIDGPDGQGNYDAAGYLPSGLTYAPQRSWNEAENYGGTAHMLGAPATKSKLGGVTVGLLTSFGSQGQYGEPWGIQYGSLDTNEWSDRTFKWLYTSPKPYSSWKEAQTCDPDNPKNCAPLCSPANFPHCAMEPMLQSGATAKFWDNKQQDAGTIYRESVNRAYDRFFVHGGAEALRDVNVTEHSTYDPCSDPSLWELLYPIAAGGALVGIFKYYGAEAIVALGATPALVIEVALFSFGYNMSKALIEYFGEPTDKYYQNAAASLVYPIAAAAGAYAGTYLYNQTNQALDPRYFTYGGALLAVRAAQPTVHRLAFVLSTSTLLAAILLGGFGALMKVVTRLWCQLTTNLDSCADYENDATNRRWDAVSIAAMLTLEVCEREGWSKDDERAEFVFRGLLSGPELLNGPVDTSIDGARTIWDQTLVNPLGYLYDGRWRQYFYSDARPTQFQRGGNVVGWDGNVSGVADVANSNLYACENWDVMRNGTQSNKHPGTRILANKFNYWIGNWEQPEWERGVLVEAANNPANILAMQTIPGWEFQRPVRVNSLPQERALPFEGAKILKEGAFTPDAPHLDPLTELGTVLTFKGLNIPPPHEYRDLAILPFVEVSDCAVVWRDEILSGNSRWASYSPAEVQQAIESVLAATNCDTCAVEDIGKLESLRLALSGSQSLTCAEFVGALQHFGWTPDVIQHAVYTVASTLDSGIPALAQWTRIFLADCNNYEEPGAGFATLPNSITSKWCT